MGRILVLVWNRSGLEHQTARSGAPEFFAGILAAQSHNRQGHPSYLFGRFSLKAGGPTFRSHLG